MATKTTSEHASLAEKPYFGEEPEKHESRLFTLGDADKVALDTVRALTEVMNAAGKMGETRVFDALADMRSDLLAVQQSLSLAPDEMSEQVATARTRLDAHAQSSLAAIQGTIFQRLEQGNLPEGVDVKTERKAIEDAFHRVSDGFKQLMPEAPAAAHTAPQQTDPHAEIDSGQVKDRLKKNFEETVLGQQGASAPQGQPLPQGWTPSDAEIQHATEQTRADMQQSGWTPQQSHAQAELQRRQAAAMAAQQGQGGGRRA